MHHDQATQYCKEVRVVTKVVTRLHQSDARRSLF